jgi:IMP dehydrogenase
MMLRPAFRTRANSRSEINLRTKFTRNIEINNPFVASPMDSVCDADMCIAMWRAGGIGVLHRFWGDDEYEEQIKKLDKFKKENPNFKYTIAVGIKDYESKLLTFLNNGFSDESSHLKYDWPDAVLLDVAHGGSNIAIQTIEDLIKIRNIERDVINRGTFDIIAGNITTYEGAYAYAKMGVDGLRCTVGAGSVCITRSVTGVGVPIPQAIMEARTAVNEVDKDIAIMCDGGMNDSSDCAKVLAIGADCIMSGKFFADTLESPGWQTLEEAWDKVPTHYKEYRGMARFGDRAKEGINEPIYVNGGLTPVATRIKELCDGIQSSFSYIDAMNIEESRNAEFQIVTPMVIETENKTRGFK